MTGHLQLAVLLGGVSFLLAALPPEVTVGDPCCNVLTVDPARGVVNAFERKSGNLFSFSVKDQALLSEIKPCQFFNAELAGAKEGEELAADFGGAGKAKVNPGAPCCEITTAPGTAGRAVGVQPHATHQGVEIILTKVERTGGNLVTATCMYCNSGPAEVSLATDLRARKTKAKLLDTQNQIEYQVERPGGKALVSDHGAGFKLRPNQPLTTWMKFTAPEGNRVTLIIPGVAEPFQDIAIAK